MRAKRGIAKFKWNITARRFATAGAFERPKPLDSLVNRAKLLAGSQMFGIICGGRPVQTDVQQVDSLKYVLEVKDAAGINHLVVFVLPNGAIPPDMAASVYLQLPGKEFQLLGILTSVKASAIFKINAAASTSRAFDLDDMMADDDSAPSQQFNLTIGISIEPLAVAEAALAALRQSRAAPAAIMAPPIQVAAPTDPEGIAVLANKIVQHAYNYLSGFTSADGRVPMKAFDDWWSKFKTRIAANPRFLDDAI